MLLDGPHPDDRARTLAGRARAALDAFSEGRMISVRLPPSKNVRAQLALLEPAGDEVWEFRIRNDRPQLRIFGHFAEKDLFVALTHAQRDAIITDEDWEKQKQRCRKEWNRFLSPFNPHTGQTADDYVSDAVPL